MNKTLPNKWIRKAIYDAINNIDVNGEQIPCFDQFVSAGGNVAQPHKYFLVNTQGAQQIKDNKCSYDWEATAQIDCIVRHEAVGNNGSSLSVDDITDGARAALDGLTLDGASGLKLVLQTMEVLPSDPIDLSEELIYRNIIRLDLHVE